MSEQGLTIGYMLARALRRHASRVAVVETQRTRTYGELDQRSLALARWLISVGCRTGDRVAVLMDNRAEFIEAELAAIRSGLVKVPVNNRLSALDVARIVADCGATALVTEAAYAPLLADVRERAPALLHVVCIGAGGTIEYEEALLRGREDVAFSPGDDPDSIALIRYSGGTTGAPKGIVHTSGALAAATLSVLREYGIGPSERFLHAAHLSHGQNFVWPALACAGARMVMLKKFDPSAVLATIESQKVTRVHLVPTMAALLLDTPDFDRYDLSSLRNFVYASAPMPVERIRQLRAKLACNIAQTYTLSESPVITTVLGPEDHDVSRADFDPAKLASCGREAVDVRIRIVNATGADVPAGEVGELAVLSPSNMKEYWCNPDLTRQTLREGWVLTGDLGYRDPQEYIYLVDRKDDKIITGALNVYPREVEDVLHAHPAVREVAVGGVPDEKWGESIVAFVALRSGHSPTADELIGFCENRLAAYKKPKRVVFVENLPKTPVGKISRRELVAPYWAGRQRRVN